MNFLRIIYQFIRKNDQEHVRHSTAHHQVRDDIPHKSPPNKGLSQNLPKPYDNRLKQEPIKWLHENARHFIATDNKFGSVIRYLPGSLQVNKPPSVFA